MKRNPKTRRGQTLIEFAFVSVLFIFMLVLTFNSILAFSIHQYISYAAFMGARAYQASAETPQTQVQNAKTAFAQLIPGLSASEVGPGMSFPVFFRKFSERKALARIVSVTIDSPQEGVYGTRGNSQFKVVFDVPFAELPLGSEVGKQIAAIRLTTQSSLGREVTHQECKDYFRGRYMKILQPIKAAGAPGLSAGSGYAYDLWENMEDNGC